MATDSLISCVTKPSATNVMLMLYKFVLVVHEISTHYSVLIMGAMAFQITGLTMFRGRSKKTSLAFVTGEFPAQRASNAVNVSI